MSSGNVAVLVSSSNGEAEGAGRFLARWPTAMAVFARVKAVWCGCCPAPARLASKAYTEEADERNVQIMSKHVVATVGEIRSGQRKLVTIRGRQIAVFNLGGEFFGLFNRCPHQGGPMCEGILTGLIESDEPGNYRYSRKGEILRCPWHGWEFDVRTGQSFCDPSKISVRSYAVEVAEGQRVMQGPYVAETIPVMVEEQYVVVEM
jgi:nitrite reductase/ring-hydroxylating ferredoxin subunit